MSNSDVKNDLMLQFGLFVKVIELLWSDWAVGLINSCFDIYGKIPSC